jgi:serine/threonine protein kinase
MQGAGRSAQHVCGGHSQALGAAFLSSRRPTNPNNRRTKRRNFLGKRSEKKERQRKKILIGCETEAQPMKEIGYYTVSGDLGVGQCGVVRKGNKENFVLFFSSHSVLLATHRTTGVEVAIKTLSRSVFAEIGLKWSNRELELMRFLNHPNIVKVREQSWKFWQNAPWNS